MKTIFILLSCIMFTSVSFAQGVQNPDLPKSEKYIQIPISSLTEAQKAELDKNKSTVEQLGEWVGLGKEIGTAVNEGLGALTDHANKFAGTPVGKFTMIIIAYKVMGRDLVHYVAGVGMFFIFTTFFIFYFVKNCMDKRILTSETKEGVKTYEIYCPEDSQKLLAMLFYGISLCASLITFFS